MVTRKRSAFQHDSYCGRGADPSHDPPYTGRATLGDGLRVPIKKHVRTQPSPALTTTQIRYLIEAAGHAFALEKAPTAFITIHVDKGRFRTSAQDVVGQYIKHAGDWLGLHGIRRFHVWVLENPSDGGLNAHILLHVPADLFPAFRESARQRKWLRAVGASANNLARVIKVKRITGSGSTDSVDDTIYNLARLTLYLCKGLDPQASKRFGVRREPQGIVHGKRCGTSETLTLNARRRDHVMHDGTDTGTDHFWWCLHMMDTLYFTPDRLERAAVDDGVTDAATELFGRRWRDLPPSSPR